MTPPLYCPLQVYGYMKPLLEAAMTDFSGYLYITHDEDAEYPYGFIQVKEAAHRRAAFDIITFSKTIYSSVRMPSIGA